MLSFLTGNKQKFEEIKAFIPEIIHLDIDLPEIQHSDARIILDAKLKEAYKHHRGSFIVEDTSLHLDCLGGLPGPLIKWFLKALKNEGLHKIAEKLGNTEAEAKTIIGYINEGNEERFFEGSLHGKIVKPRGESGFGWDPIFQPHGYTKTFAEMSKEEKNTISMRRAAVDALKVFLDSQTSQHT